MPPHPLDPPVLVGPGATGARAARCPEPAASTLARLTRWPGDHRPGSASRGGDRGRAPAARGMRASAPAVAVLAALAWLAVGAAPALALKVVTWNVINYPPADLASRQPNLRTAIAALDPDVIMLQELMSAAEDPRGGGS